MTNKDNGTDMPMSMMTIMELGERIRDLSVELEKEVKDAKKLENEQPVSSVRSEDEDKRLRSE